MFSKQSSISQVGFRLGLEEYFNVLDSMSRAWITEGKYSRLVNNLLSNAYQSESFLVPNGTLAIYLALSSLSLPTGSTVVVPNLTFFGSASPTQFLGLNLSFADVSEHTANSTFENIKAAITDDTKCVIVVGLFGSFQDLSEIYDYCKRRGIFVIIDAAQALFVTYNNCSIMQFCDIAITSFFADKVVGCGEGGAVLVRDPALADKIRLLRNQGRPSSGTFVHPSIGMNFRITDLQCAVLAPRLVRYQKVVSKRLLKLSLYRKILENDNRFSFLSFDQRSSKAPFRFVLKLNDIDVNLFCSYLEQQGIQVRRMFHPLSLQPPFSQFNNVNLPSSVFLSETSICLPVHDLLSLRQVRYIASTCLNFSSY